MRCVIEPNSGIGYLWTIRGSIKMDPDYQREPGVWSKEKRQLFIDSIFNGYDIPKLYFHDLSEDSPTYHYAVVDGKQRLQTLFDFMEDKLPLGDFDTLDKDVLKSVMQTTPPKPGKLFSELSEVWQNYFRNRSLPVIVVSNANREDIENLFARLNNGEPLNGAEKRNAIPGDMTDLIRIIGADPFFGKWTPFGKRYQHYEIAAKFLLMEQTMLGPSAEHFCNTKKAFLDKMVKSGKKMLKADQEKLRKRVEGNIKILKRVFKEGDPLLKKPTPVPLYYAFCASVVGNYAHPQLHQKLQKFLEKFQAERELNQQRSEDTLDAELIEFGLQSQYNNDKESIRARMGILTRRFLQQCPDVQIKDPQRNFSDDERFAIWVNGEKKCAACGRDINLKDMDADHRQKWADGGSTTLANARCLCKTCNRSDNQTTPSI